MSASKIAHFTITTRFSIEQYKASRIQDTYISSYISELLYSGHSIKHLFFCKLPLLEWHNLKGTRRRDFRVRIERVFKSLSTQKEWTRWTIYFKLYSRDEISTEYPKIVNNIDFFNGPVSVMGKNVPKEFKEVSKNVRYAKVVVKSSDPHLATLVARSMLEMVMDIIGFSVVNQHLEIMHYAYIPEYGKKLESTLPQLYEMKLRTEYNYIRIIKTMKGLRLTETIHRIHSCLSFYRIGVTSGSSQVAYMNFWTALEFFVTGNKANTNIRELFDNISILLSINYLAILLNDLLSNIIKLNTPQLSGEKAWNEFEPSDLLKILRDPAKVQNLKTAVQSQLLCFRIDDLVQKTATNAKIYELLVAHRQRICWQLSRLYRKRNLLAHEANSSNINILLPNLHQYLFNTIENILKLIEG